MTSLEIAAMAMQGLLADHKDYDHEREYLCKECGHSIGTIAQHAHGHIKSYGHTVYRETCAQAVARIAFEHTDALIQRADTYAPGVPNDGLAFAKKKEL